MQNSHGTQNARSTTQREPRRNADQQLGPRKLQPHAPRILSSTRDARAIALAIPAGESLQEHQVHERAWVTILAGEVEITTTTGAQTTGQAGLVVEFDPSERHAVHALTDTRLLLLLTPWPGSGHPGPIALDEKAHAREHASEHALPPNAATEN